MSWPCRFAVCLAVVGVAIEAHASTFSVTVSPSAETAPWTGSNFAASNPTPVPVVQTLPTCNYTVTCDRVNVTVSGVTQAYLDANPGKQIIFTIQWPDATADFDLYVMNAADATRLTASAGSSNPEIATLPIQLGTTSYTLRIVPYTVVPGDGYTGSVSLAEPGAPPPPPGGFGLGQYVAGVDVFSCNFHLTGIDANGNSHDQDAEPAVKFDLSGTAFVVSNGNGLGIWRTTDACGRDATFVGSDLINGGGDGDVETASVKNANGYYNVYTSSLHSLDALVNINASVSYDGGKTFLTTPITNATPLNDRQWNAAYGKDWVFLSYRSANTGNQQFCVRAQAVEGLPLTFGPSAPVYTDLGTITVLESQSGTMVADQRPGADLSNPNTPHAGTDGEGNVYHGFTINGNRVYVALSRDFGITWHDVLAFEGAEGSSYDHIFTWVAVDQAGNVYTCFSDDHNVYYTVSADIKTSDTPTWSLPVRVNDGVATKTAAFPAMAAGSAGQVVFTWYGSLTLTAHETGAQWRVFHARCDNALAPLGGGVPVFEQVLVSDHVVHNGDLCEGGTLGCPVAGSRALLDDFEIDISPVDGASFITYTDDSPVGGSFITRELAGRSAIAGKTVPDRTGVCLVAAAGCGSEPPPPESRCDLPGLTAVADPEGDQTVLGGSSDDIRKISFAEPFRADLVEKLTITMTVSSIDPANLPLNHVWYVLFNNPGVSNTTYFVDMSTCDPVAGTQFEYGTFDATLGFSQLGLADAGRVLPDGRIEITITKSLVGNPQAGHTLQNISGSARLFAGAACTGLVSQVDGTANGTYPVGGNCAVTAVPRADPSSISLALGGGNPFRGRTLLSYAIPEPGAVRITVFNVAGRRVCTLVDGPQEAGVHTVPFDLATSAGHRLGPGVYLVQLEAAGARRHVRVIGLR